MTKFSLWFLLILLLAGQAQAQAQTVPATTFTGTINSETPYVAHEVTVAEGSGLTLTLSATQGTLSPYLLLVDAAGNVIAEQYDETRLNPRPRIAISDLAGGVYQVIASRYNILTGDTEGNYVLTVTITAATADDQVDYSADVTPAALLTAGYQDAPVAPEADWTVLAYYGGDNDLEQFIINDTEEFELGGGSTDNVQVVALLDRSQEFFSTSTDDWSGARVFHVQAATHPIADSQLDTPPLFDLGAVDTGSGRTLAQFLVWGIRHYPAKRYIVAFATHGNGWQGISVDFAAPVDDQVIPLVQLDAAFRAAQAELSAAGDRKIALVINDACLMSSVEYTQMLSQYADYALASPEVVKSPALDMRLLLERLQADPQLDIADPTQLATPLIEKYFADIATDSQHIYMSYALVKLDQVPALVSDLSTLAQQLIAQPAALGGLLGQARAAAYTYTAYAGVYTKTDLGDLLTQLNRLTDDSALQTTIRAVQRDLKAAIITSQAGNRLQPHTSYFNIYFPENRRDFNSGYYDLNTLPAWKALLRTYFNELIAPVWVAGEVLNFHPPLSPRLRIISTLPATTDSATPPSTDPVTGFTLQVEISGRNLTQGVLQVTQPQAIPQPDGTTRAQPVVVARETVTQPVITDAGLAYRSEWTPGASVRPITWSARLTQVSDGMTSALALVEPAEDQASASLLADITLPDSRTPVRATIIFDELDYDERLGAIVAFATSAVTATTGDTISVLDLPAGTLVQTIRTVIGRGGRLSDAAGPVFTIGAAGLTYRWVNAPAHDYEVTFTLATFGGQDASVSAPVRVVSDPSPSAFQTLRLFDQSVALVLKGATWDSFLYQLQGYYHANDLASALDDNDEYSHYVDVYPFGDLYGGAEANLTDLINRFLDRIGAQPETYPVADDLAVGQTALFTYIPIFNAVEGEIYPARIVRTAGGFLIITGSADLDLAATADSFLEVAALSSDPAAANARWQPFTVSWDADQGSMPLPVTWRDHLRDTLDGMTLDAEIDGVPTWFQLSVRAAGSTTTVSLPAEQITQVRPYYSERFPWQVEFLTFTHQGQRYEGRRYTTTTALGSTYSLTFATPPEQADAAFSTTFELMVDGFDIPQPLRIYRAPFFDLELDYDRQWSFVAETEVEDTGYNSFSTGNLNASQQVFGYWSDTEAASGADFATEIIAVQGFTQRGAPVPGTLAGRDGAFVNFTFPDPEFPTLGRGFATIFARDGVRVGLLLTFETSQLAMSAPQLEDLFNQLVSARVRFNGVGQADALAVPTDGLLWSTYTPPVLNVPFTLAVPRTWQEPRRLGGTLEWRSPTDLTRLTLEIVSIATDDNLSLSAGCEDCEPVTLAGRPARRSQDGTTLVTYLPEQTSLLIATVQGEDTTLAADLLARISARWQWQFPAITFDAAELTQHYAYLVDVQTFVQPTDTAAETASEPITGASLPSLTLPTLADWLPWSETSDYYATQPANDAYTMLMAYFFQTGGLETMPVVESLQFIRQVLLASIFQYQSADSGTLIEVDGQPALRFSLFYESSGVRFQGDGVVVLLADGNAVLITAEAPLIGRYPQAIMFQCVLDTLRRREQPSQPCDWQSTTSLSADGLSFEAPLATSPLTVVDDFEDSLYWATYDDDALYYFIYPVAPEDSGARGIMLEDTFDALDEWALTLTDDPELVITASGLEVATFRYTKSHALASADETLMDIDTVGRGVAVVANDQLYIIGLEVPAADESDSDLLDTAYALLQASLRLPPD